MTLTRVSALLAACLVVLQLLASDRVVQAQHLPTTSSVPPADTTLSSDRKLQSSVPNPILPRKLFGCDGLCEEQWHGMYWDAKGCSKRCGPVDCCCCEFEFEKQPAEAHYG